MTKYLGILASLKLHFYRQLGLHLTKSIDSCKFRSVVSRPTSRPFPGIVKNIESKRLPNFAFRQPFCFCKSLLMSKNSCFPTSNFA